MSCEYLERDVDAYVDGELDASAAAVLRAHLRGCLQCSERVAALETLCRVVRAAPYYTAPAQLRAAVLPRQVRPAVAHRALALVAVAVLALIGVGGFSYMLRGHGGVESPVEEVTNAHVRSLLADHLYDVRSTDQHTVKPWFLGKLDFAPPVTDLAASGFPLRGGRLDMLEGRPVAALVYERGQHVINVFIRPVVDGQASPLVGARTVRGFNVRQWTGGGMVFWAVSDLNEAEFAAFTERLQPSP